jgi:hypothetical protein
MEDVKEPYGLPVGRPVGDSAIQDGDIRAMATAVSARSDTLI